jgi:hypothetical protein
MASGCPPSFFEQGQRAIQSIQELYSVEGYHALFHQANEAFQLLVFATKMWVGDWWQRSWPRAFEQISNEE